jgi:YD repeat-containing protein
MVTQSIDPLLNSTSFTYDSTGTFLSQVQYSTTSGVAHVEHFSIDPNTGLTTSHTDQNGLITSTQYDVMRRVTQVNYPDGGLITNCYTDLGGPFCTQTAPPFAVVSTRKINLSQTETTTAKVDGLGRLTQTQVNSDPQGTVYTDTTYDALGRMATVSNPYRTCGSDITSSCGSTTYGYDALSRKTSETLPDNSVLTTAYCGPSTLVKDPTNRWRRSRSDALGRLVEVDEPNSSTATVVSTGCPGTGEPIWVTTYGYDALGNLISVLQNGSHSRSFTNDSLSRLLTSTNPEVGTITYTYDPNSNVATKKDARNITTTYTYDALNREKTATYSNNDPTVSMNYDGTNCLGLTACQNIGHRTSMTDAGGSEIWSYQVDATNHRSLRNDQRTTDGVTKTESYVLDLAANTTQITYIGGRVVNYAFDSANRPSTATDSIYGVIATGFKTTPGSTCLANATCYTPQGTVYAESISPTFTIAASSRSNSKPPPPGATLSTSPTATPTR